MGLVVAVGAALVGRVPGPMPAGQDEVREAAHRDIARAMSAMTSGPLRARPRRTPCRRLLRSRRPRGSLSTDRGRRAWARLILGRIPERGLRGGSRTRDRRYRTARGSDAADAKRPLRTWSVCGCIHRSCRVPNPAARRCRVDVRRPRPRHPRSWYSRTLLQRVAQPDMLARVFGVVEAISMVRTRAGLASASQCSLQSGACRSP